MLEPKSEAELAEAVAGANGALSVRGGGTRGLAGAGEVLSVAGLSGISLYEPGALTLVAAAGTPLAEVEAALAGEGQMLAFEPMDHRPLLGTTGAPTVGGMAAANICGPRRVQAGACRDAMLGVRFVDGTGAVVLNGGRVMKNVTGYDLVKLMAGSYGTLGILSEVAFKVLPRPEAAATVIVQGVDAAGAVGAMAAALGSPYDVTGAAYLGARRAAWIRVEGFEASVAYRAGELAARLGGYGAAEVGTADWAEVRDVLPLAGMGAVWRAALRPSAAPALVQALAALGVGDVVLDWGGGRVWAGAAEATGALHAKVQSAAAALGGHAALVKAPAALAGAARFAPQDAGIARLEAGLRARFDPKGRLNPGLMGAAA